MHSVGDVRVLVVDRLDAGVDRGEHVDRRPAPRRPAARLAISSGVGGGTESPDSQRSSARLAGSLVEQVGQERRAGAEHPRSR